MNGHELLEKVAPGFQGMVPPDADDLNPNQQPDASLNKALGPGLGYNPVAIALDRRQTINEIEKAIDQLTARALAEGVALTRPEAIMKVKQIWAQQAPATPSSTLQLPQSIPTQTRPLSKTQRQDFLKRTEQNQSTTTPFAGITPQPSTPAPASPPPIEQIAAVQHNGELWAPTVMDIRRQLGITDYDPLFPVAEVCAPEPTEASPIISEGPTAEENKSRLGLVGLSMPEQMTAADVDIKEAVGGIETDPAVDGIFADILAGDHDAKQSSLEGEMKEDMYGAIHESTRPLLRALPTTQCVTFFRQSLTLAGLPQWSRWTPDQRTKVEAAYKELASDPFEVDQIVRHLQQFSVKYGKQRLLRMVSTILGIQAWMSTEVH